MCSVPSELNDKRKSLFKWLVYCFWFISDSGRKNHNVFASALRRGERTDRAGNHLPPHQREMKKKDPGTGLNDKSSHTSRMAVVNWDFMDDQRSLSLPLGGSTEWKWHRGTKADRHFSSQNLGDSPRPRRQLGTFAWASEVNYVVALVFALAYTRPPVALSLGSCARRNEIRATPAAWWPGARHSGSWAALVLVSSNCVPVNADHIGSPTLVLTRNVTFKSHITRLRMKTEKGKKKTQRVWRRGISKYWAPQCWKHTWSCLGRAGLAHIMRLPSSLMGLIKISSHRR